MRMIVNEVRLELGQCQAVSVVNGVGTRITCESGCLWLTQHRDVRDVMLDAGDSFVLDRAGTALIQAIRPGTLFIREATFSSAAQRAFAVARAAWRRTVAVLGHVPTRPMNARA